MIFSKVLLEGIVVDIVLLLSPGVHPIADVTSLVPVPAMCIELVIAVEALSAKPTLRMAFKSTLVNRSRVVVAELLMFVQLSRCE